MYSAAATSTPSIQKRVVADEMDEAALAAALAVPESHPLLWAILQVTDGQREELLQDAAMLGIEPAGSMAHSRGADVLRESADEIWQLVKQANAERAERGRRIRKRNNLYPCRCRGPFAGRNEQRSEGLCSGLHHGLYIKGETDRTTATVTKAEKVNHGGFVKLSARNPTLSSRRLQEFRKITGGITAVD